MSSIPGSASPCSRRSAKILSASAFAFATASESDPPYASAPDSSGTSASHRPSSSCSDSTVSVMVKKVPRVWTISSGPPVLGVDSPQEGEDSRRASASPSRYGGILVTSKLGDEVWNAFDGPRSAEFDSFQCPVDQALAEYDTTANLAALALSFDGYAAFGNLELMAQVKDGVEERWGRNRKLPTNLGQLRACLFVEQRASHHTDSPLERPYTRALVEAIRQAAAAFRK